RFMVRYAPTIKDLASRDVVSRAMTKEILEGRGVGPKKDHILLVLEKIDPQIIRERLPGIKELAENFAGVDCTKEPIPVHPTAHYVMGGIPTDRYAQAVTGSMTSPEEPIPGFYAAGEAACTSVHGANRLGTNSLLDLIVFGKVGGQHMRDFALSRPDPLPLEKSSWEKGLAEVSRLLSSGGSERLGSIMNELQESMDKNVGVFRTQESLLAQSRKLEELKERYNRIGLNDRGPVYNLDLVEALELGHMLDVASAVVEAALARKESRGTHYRDDFPKRDDENWLKHTLVYLEEDGSLRLDYKPVRLKPLTVDTIEPKERVY
ncbi:MAG: FAD-binding protein, partial [Pseudomonadota bacterium]